MINYLVKCFSYATAQNKGDSKGIQAAIKSIVPHAFGDHSNCETSWCKFKSNPGTYKHKELPYGKDLQGKKLELELNNIFNDYSTDAVAEKLAPLTNSQRNEALNSVIGSKNPKIRFYGGSESNDFRVACGVAQTNLRYTYISNTLEALNIEPGNFCEMYGEKMTNHVQKDKLRESSLAYKRGRANACRRNSAQTAKKEVKEGKTYETGIGPNLDLSILPSRTMKEIETIVSPYTPRPLATYTLPVHDIDHFASKVNKLKIVKVNGERKLYKDNKEVSTLPLKEAMSQFLGFVSRSVERTKSRTNKNVVTVLLGHNSLTFDVPVLLRNSESDFKERLQAMDVFFADSLTLFKTLVREKFSFLRNPDGTHNELHGLSNQKTPSVSS